MATPQSSAAIAAEIATLLADISAVLWTNNKGLVTGPVVQNLFDVVQSIAAVQNASAWNQVDNPFATTAQAQAGVLSTVFLSPATAVTQGGARGQVSFTDFGGVGDGVTLNDAAIAAMIAGAAGRLVFVPEGKYLFSQNATIPLSIPLNYEAGALFSAQGGSGAVLSFQDTTFRVGGAQTLSQGAASRHTLGVECFINSDSFVNSTLGEIDFNYFRINTDNIDLNAGPAQFANGFGVDHHFGGTNTTGSRQAVQGRVIQDAPTASRSTSRNYVGVTGQTISAVGDGGTSTSNYVGTYFGGNFVSTLSSGAMFTSNATACEFNNSIFTGASTQYRSGIQIAGGGNVQGDTYDAAISISNLGTATVPWKVGILLGPQNGSAPLGSATGGAVLRLAGVATMDRGIDFSTTAFNTVLLTPTINLTSSKLIMTSTTAGLQLGSVTTTGTGNVDFFSSGTPAIFDSRIIGSGGNGTQGNGTLQFIAATIAFSGLQRPTTDNAYANGAANFRWTNVFATTLNPGNGSALWTTGTGSPNGVLAAPVGSLYTDLGGGAGTTLYVKETGSGNTGWTTK